MSQEYLFDSKDDYYNAIISNVGTSMKYTLTSVIIRPGQIKTTTLRSPQGSEGTIHWRERMIEIGGVRHLIDDVKRKEGGPRSFTYLWGLGQRQWQSSYASDSKSWKVWPVDHNAVAENVAVEFKPYRSRAFRKAEAAQLRVSVSDVDSIFIILFLIHTQIIEGPRSSFTLGDFSTFFDISSICS